MVQAFIVNELNLIKEKAQPSGSSTVIANTENKIIQLRALLNLILSQINSSKIEIF